MAKVEAEVGKRPEGMWGGLIKWIDDRFPMTETLEYHVTEVLRGEELSTGGMYSVCSRSSCWRSS